MSTDMKASVTLEFNENLTRKADRVEDSLDDLAKAAQKNAKAGDKLKKGFDGADRALGQLGREARRSGRELDRLGREARQADRAMDGLRRAARRTGTEASRAMALARRAGQGVAGAVAAGGAMAGRAAARGGAMAGTLAGAAGGRALAGGRGALAGLARGGVAGLGIGAAFGVAGSVGGSIDAEATRDELAVKAGVSDARMQAADRILRARAVELKSGAGELYAAANLLLDSGMAFDKAIAGTPTVVKTAKASKSAIEDIAATANALMTNLGIGVDELPKALDTLVEAGKAGAFELRDMAKAFPSLTAGAARLGLTGQKAVERLSAMGQTIRKTAGTSAEAATNFENVIAKVTAPDVLRNFKELGIDAEKAYRRASEEGEDLLSVFLRLAQQATGGDPLKLSELVPDLQARNGTAALLAFGEETERLERRVSQATGAVERDFERMTGNVKGSLGQLGAAISNLADRTIGPALGRVSKGIEGVSKSIDSLDGRRGGLFGKGGLASRAAGLLPEASDDRKRATARDMRQIGEWIFGVPAERARGRANVQRLDAERASMETLGRLRRQRDRAAQALGTPGMLRTSSSMATRLSRRPGSRGVVVPWAERTGAAAERRAGATLPSYRATTAAELGLEGISAGEVKIEGLKRAIEETPAAAVQAAGRIEQAFQAIDLAPAGMKMSQSLAAGIRAGIPAVSAAAGEAAAAASAYFPQSPAKRGPLRRLPYAGSQIVAQLAAGMDARPAVLSASRLATRISGAVVGGAAPARRSGRAGGSAAADGRAVTVKIGAIHVAAGGGREAGRQIARELAATLSATLGDVAGRG